MANRSLLEEVCAWLKEDDPAHQCIYLVACCYIVEVLKTMGLVSQRFSPEVAAAQHGKQLEQAATRVLEAANRALKTRA